jgi:Phytanoyl-CoA dioxygenase (PhyH).
MNSNDYIKKYDKYGYFKIENFFNNLEISKIIDEINNSKDVDIFKDNNNVIRRIERIYNKGEYLKRVNLQFKKLILKYLNLNVLLFKDKFNLKPPGGEGFYAHYDGIFYFTDNKNIKKRGWYEYGNNFINILLAIDDCNEENGTLELARSNDKSFEELIKNTKQDGTQELLETIEKKLVLKK